MFDRDEGVVCVVVEEEKKTVVTIRARSRMGELAASRAWAPGPSLYVCSFMLEVREAVFDGSKGHST